MPKGARTVAELDRAVAILHTRDATRARAIRALRGDVDRIEALIDRAELHILSLPEPKRRSF